MIQFTKMHGIGNDFVMIDAIEAPPPATPLDQLALKMCDRRFGVGADGVILAERSDTGRFRMRMLNPDGSESEMCGNGIRCMAKFLIARGHDPGPTIAIDTIAGLLETTVLDDGRVTVDMGVASFALGDIGAVGDPDAEFVESEIAANGRTFTATAVSMGNPHLVIFVESFEGLDVAVTGSALERHEMFPNRINVHFLQRVSSSRLVQKTWERGAGETHACGTGACASAAVAHRTGRSDRRVTVDLPGGTLEIDNSPNGHMLMTGPATTVFDGVWDSD